MINRNIDSIYNFFTAQINRANADISTTKAQINALAKKQTELKRGKAYLVKLRREYNEKNKNKKNTEA